MDDLSVIILFVVIAIVCVTLAIVFARRFRTEYDKLTPEAKEEHLASPIVKLFGLVATDIGGLMHVFRLWKAAPTGSLAKLGWGLALALLLAVAIWLVLKSFDAWINRESTSK